MKAILLCFEGVSSLKVNFFKSELIDIRIDTSQTILADIRVFGFTFMQWQCFSSTLELMIERTERKLASWRLGK